MVTLYIFLLIVAAIGALAYVGLFMSHVPGAADERFGAYEALPDNLDRWVEDEHRSEDGMLCERRHLMPKPGGTKLILQVRYRNPETREIVRIEAEQTIKRKRRRA